MPARLAGLLIVIATLALPLAGAALAGRDLAAFFRFPPPLEIPRDFPTWSWAAAACVIAPFLAMAWSWRRAICTTPPGREAHMSARAPADAGGRGLPWWGWVALAWTVAWWVLAWTRFSWFAGAQPYTFFPLWLGFIVTVNAVTWRASGTCLLTRAPGAWLGLFAASAVFWWVFEWLNRFVRNWHYLGVEDFGPAAYAVHASLCFSTVLPAVSAVSEWLATHRTWRARWAAGPAWRWLDRRGTGLALIAAGLLALVFTGARPREFYPALWAAPLALALGDSIRARREGLASEIARGDWTRAAPWALAALVCGFFWEMWNLHSAAKWIYTVPYVNAGHVFEMSVLGYFGYLPFGLECLLVVERLGARAATRV